LTLTSLATAARLGAMLELSFPRIDISPQPAPVLELAHHHATMADDEEKNRAAGSCHQREDVSGLWAATAETEQAEQNGNWR
jgi:hypothetical protein